MMPSVGAGATRLPNTPASLVAYEEASAAEVCIVVPTRNEAGNIPALTSRLRAALSGTRAEVLFVDDSSDETPDVIRDVAQREQCADFLVRLHHRPPGDRGDGLGGAVLAGMRATSAGAVVVMDADLQHPPEVVPELLSVLKSSTVDVVVGSRYCGGGDAQGLSNVLRAFASRGTTVLARGAFPRVLRSVTDPMSGFFAVRRAALPIDALRPRGFKVLLELLAGSGGASVQEVPFSFGERTSGSSKASLREGLRYLGRLLALRLDPSTSLGRFLRFGLVGISGILVNLLVLAATLGLVGRGIDGRAAVAEILATQVAIAWNFVLTELWVFRGREGRWWVRLPSFVALSNAALLAQLPLAAAMSGPTGVSYLIATAASIATLVVVRYVVCDLLLFPREPKRPRTT
jgi:dolichol-phosphate mannosyltransferase